MFGFICFTHEQYILYRAFYSVKSLSSNISRCTVYSPAQRFIFSNNYFPFEFALLPTSSKISFGVMSRKNYLFLLSIGFPSRIVLFSSFFPSDYISTVILFQSRILLPIFSWTVFSLVNISHFPVTNFVPMTGKIPHPDIYSTKTFFFGVLPNLKYYSYYLFVFQSWLSSNPLPNFPSDYFSCNLKNSLNHILTSHFIPFSWLFFSAEYYISTVEFSKKVIFPKNIF